MTTLLFYKQEKVRMTIGQDFLLTSQRIMMIYYDYEFVSKDKSLHLKKIRTNLCLY